MRAASCCLQNTLWRPSVLLSPVIVAPPPPPPYIVEFCFPIPHIERIP
jgi:hypothetical protein